MKVRRTRSHKFGYEGIEIELDKILLLYTAAERQNVACQKILTERTRISHNLQ